MEELFRAYFDRLYSLVFYNVGKDRAIAEDVTQEIFVSALKLVKSFRGKCQPYTWLVGIANHKIADYYRRLERERKHISQTPIDTVTSTQHTPDSELEKTLSGIPFHYRQVLLLKYVEEMPVLEISQIMKRSPKSIEGLLNRARKALRDSQGKMLEG